MVFIIARVTIIIRKKLDIFFLTIDIENFMKKIIKSYFNIYYIKLFYLLQQDIKLNKNIYNISVLTNVFMNLYDNSNIDCNKNYMICIIILFLINSLIVINIKVIFSLVIINRSDRPLSYVLKN